MDPSSEREQAEQPRVPGKAVPSGERFPRSLRLGHRREFDRVFQQKCSVAEGDLVIYGLRNDYPYPRLGLSVGKRVGNAVQRNRWKRAVREAFRRQRRDLPSGLDMVVVVRGSRSPQAAEVYAQLKSLAWRLSRRLERRR